MQAKGNKETTGPGKNREFILDTAANPSFIQSEIGTKAHTTNPRTLQITNGQFRSDLLTTVTVQAQNKTTKANAIVRKRLQANLLTNTPIVYNLGALLFDKSGAAQLTPSIYHTIKKREVLLRNAKITCTSSQL